VNIHRYALWLALTAAFWAATVSAAEPEAAGTIKTAHGSVTLDRAGKKIEASVGTPVLVGDRVHAGPKSYVGITLDDNTLLTAGPDSTLLVTQFRFNAESQEGNMLVSLLKGTFSLVTGLIAKRSPEAVKFKTPTMTLGVRGTEFVVEVSGEAG
jgi:hypothetical protein